MTRSSASKVKVSNDNDDLYEGVCWRNHDSADDEQTEYIDSPTVRVEGS